MQYHQYAPIGHYSTNLAPYQRTVHDLFIPDDLREEIQKKSAAALQTLPSTGSIIQTAVAHCTYMPLDSQLPNHIESYHSLVPLDTNQKSSTIFGGYTSWVYKAQSSANGHLFALRRIEGRCKRFVGGPRLMSDRLPVDQRIGHSLRAGLETPDQCQCGQNCGCIHQPWIWRFLPFCRH